MAHCPRASLREMSSLAGDGGEVFRECVWEEMEEIKW